MRRGKPGRPMWKMSEKGGISGRIAPLSGKPEVPMISEMGIVYLSPDRVPWRSRGF